MNPEEEGDSRYEPKSPRFDKGKAQIGFSSSVQSGSESIMFSSDIMSPSFSLPGMGASHPFSPSGSFFMDSAPSLSMDDIGFSESIPEYQNFSITHGTVSSSVSDTFELKPSPVGGGAPNPIVSGTGDESETIGVPQPLECLQGNPVPPFLSKTFDIVDDHLLDSIISWGSNGQSFVVWDPMEFSRQILPRNFKHNNFSSFVRQLNTYGFRKIDTDRWEFANEAFLRGNKHLLKNIQRRKSSQSQQISSFIGLSNESSKSGIESEVEKIKKERSMLMQEAIQLQQQHRKTVQHVDLVNQRLQSAEQRQKHMVSFLAKLFQNPAFLARLKQNKEQRDITDSSRVRRKYVKHISDSSSVYERQILKYQSDFRNNDITSISPDLNSVPPGELPNYFQFKDAAIDELIASEELPIKDEFVDMADLKTGEGPSNARNKDHLFKGKGVMSPEQVMNPEYYASFPEDLAKEKNFPEFSPLGLEGIIRQEEMWSMGFDVSSGMSSSTSELWVTPESYQVDELGTSCGLSDIWGSDPVQAGEGSGMDKLVDEYPFDESGGQARKDDTSKNIDP